MILLMERRKPLNLFFERVSCFNLEMSQQTIPRKHLASVGFRQSRSSQKFSYRPPKFKEALPETRPQP